MTKRLVDQDFHRNEYIFHVVDEDPLKIIVDDDLIKQSQVLSGIEKRFFYLPVRAIVIKHVFMGGSIPEDEMVNAEKEVRFIKQFFKLGIQ